MVALVFARTSNPGRDGQESATRLINGYTELQGADGKSSQPVYSCPGLTRWDDAGFDGPCRGLIEVRGFGLYAVLGNQAVRFFNGTSSQILGAVPGTGPVRMQRNMRNAPQIGVVTEDGQYFIVDTDTGTAAPSTAMASGVLPPPNSIAFLDGYFIFGIHDGRFFHSQVNDGDNVNALSFAYAESQPGGVVSVAALRGALVVLGQRGMEIWENAGSAPFAFARNRTNIELGCIAPNSVTNTRDSLIWVDDHGSVVMMRGSEPVRISNHGLERDIAALSVEDRAGIRGLSYYFQGHEVCSLTSSGWTWEYDMATGLWHQRRSHNRANWLACSSAPFGDQIILGNDVDGRLFYLDADAQRDGSDPFVLEVTGQIMHDFPHGLIYDALEIDAVRGSGTANSGGDAEDPQIVLTWSDDGGRTWEGGLTRSLGKTGEYTKRIRFDRLGQSRGTGRLFRFSASAPVFRALMNVDLRVRQTLR
jgi:hypothetical protein